MKNFANSVTLFNKGFNKFIAQHGWVALAIPISLYLIDKLYDLSINAMNKGYTLTITAKTDNGFVLDLKPQASSE